MKPHDRRVVPLPADKHTGYPGSLHMVGGDKTFWSLHGIDIEAEIKRLNYEYERQRSQQGRHRGREKVPV